MASRKRSLGQRLVDSLKFWLVVAILSGILGAGACYFGRNYVGRHLHEMEVRQRAPEITPQPPTALAADEADDEPPVKPVVIVHEREPSSREKRRVVRELSRPQDGAQLHAAEAAREEAAAEEQQPAEDEDEKTREAEDEAGRASAPAPQTAADEQPAETAGEQYVVSAGSFADASNAKRQVERLTERGYQPYITTVEKDDITYRRVNVGVFGEREQAEQVKDRLRSQGFDAAVWTEQG
ncbi:MAG: SPOR domain-containing protein [Armatimonadota bacterium]|nr:SPOR domain-containing protein [Armatimonadota bacterium]